MSSDFEMPRDLAAEFGKKAVGQAVDQVGVQGVQSPYTPSRTLPSVSTLYGNTDPVVHIKAQLKLLTHRQMRDMCRELTNGKDIPASELPDVLDRFAYGAD